MIREYRNWRQICETVPCYNMVKGIRTLKIFFFFNLVVLVISVVLWEITPTISDSTDEPVSKESEMLRVISRSTTKISNITKLKIQSSGADTLITKITSNWLAFYVAINIIWVITRRQLTLFMSFLGFHSTRLGFWSGVQGHSHENPEDPARTQDPLITSQTLYHWATQDTPFPPPPNK